MSPDDFTVGLLAWFAALGFVGRLLTQPEEGGGCPHTQDPDTICGECWRAILAEAERHARRVDEGDSPETLGLEPRI